MDTFQKILETNSIDWCPRCTGAHINLNIKKLTKNHLEAVGNMGRDLTHWFMCPTLDEPVLIGQLKVRVRTSG